MGRDIRKIILCDTNQHPTPILLEWSYGLIDLGYEVLFQPINQGSILDINDDYDVLVYAGVPIEKLYEFELFKKRHPNTIIIGATDHWKFGYEKFKTIIDFFIGCFESIPDVKETFNKNGFNYYNIPLAGNHRLFKKIETNKIYDSSFIGTFSHGYRFEDKFLYPILNDDKYKSFLGGVKYGEYQQGFIPYEQHNLIRNQTKVNLNFHVPYQKPNMGIPLNRVDCNQSVFNIALSGNFQLCDHPLIIDYFKGNVILGDESNWLDLFEYYLNNTNEREELAYNAMLIAKNEHTWISRMEQFINILKNNYDK
jgi:spore maturation protein CgeB